MMMPHPERNFRGNMFSWKPKSAIGDFAPWALILKMFINGVRVNDFNSKFIRSVRRKPLFENVSIKFSNGNRYGLLVLMVVENQRL